MQQESGRTLLVRSQDRDPAVENVYTGLGSHKGRISWYRQLQAGEYSLKWCTIPNSVYNVTQNNNRLEVKGGGGEGELVVVPERNYTPAELANYLTAQSALTEWSYEPATFKMTVTNTTLFPVTLEWCAHHILSTLGFGRPDAQFNATPVALLSGMPHEAPNVVALALPLSIGVNFAEASGASAFEVGGRAIADSKMSDVRTQVRQEQTNLVIPYLAPVGTYNFLSSDVYKQSIRLHRPVQTLSFSLVDLSNNQPLNINGAEWEMVLQLL